MRDQHQFQSIIQSSESGRYLLDWLSRRFTYLSESEWLSAIENGRVAVNGESEQPRYELRRGDRVVFTAPLREEPSVNPEYRIIFGDSDYLVVDKPPELPSHPGGIYRRNNLLRFLKVDYPDVSLVNRLDRETSGIILAAVSDRGRKFLDPQRKQRILEKDYLVMVHGNTPADFEARGWISRDPASEVRKKQRFTEAFPDGSEAKASSTLFVRLASNTEFSLLKARLETGRTHQIRASLLAFGYPVVGDKLYGLDEKLFLRLSEGSLSDDDRRLLILGHQALHSARLIIRDPVRATETGNTGIAGREPGEELYCVGLPADFAGLAEEQFGLSLGSDEEVQALWE